MLLTGFGGCLVTLSVFAATIAEFEKHNTMGTLGVGMAALFAFLLFYAAGVDAPTYVFMTEIFPSHMRSKGMAIAVGIYAFSAIVYLQVTPLAVANIGWKYFLVRQPIPFFNLAFFLPGPGLTPHLGLYYHHGYWLGMDVYRSVRDQMHSTGRNGCEVR